MTSHKDVLKRRAKVINLAKLTIKKGCRTFPLYPSARAIALALPDGLKCSKMTVIRDLHSANFRCFVRKKVPTADNNVIRKRLKFARECLRNPPVRLHFSDEHFISTNDHTSRLQWVQRRKDLLPRERKRIHNVPHIQVWACVGKNFKSPLVFLKEGERLNNETYKTKCLARVLTSIRGCTFQQDGARAHTHRSVQPFVASHGVKLLEDWPPYSPDLNIIEELWPTLNEGIAKRCPQSLDELRQAAQDAWKEIPMRVVNAFVLSFTDKLKACVQNGGACSK